MEVRRVVTGRDEEGKSCVKWDSMVPGLPLAPGFAAFRLWATKQLPPEETEEDPRDWGMDVNITDGSILQIGRFDSGVGTFWHQTKTIDYGVVLSGEIWMQLDSGEVHLKPGDVIVQRGTRHNWANKGTETCLMLFVMIACPGSKNPSRSVD